MTGNSVSDNEITLRDALEELDQERCKRKELEEKLSALKVEYQAERRQGFKNDTVYRENVLKLDAECEGYLQLIQTLIQLRPAFSIPQSLPPQVLLLLENTPWSSKAQPHLLDTQQVFEWQVNGSDQKWQTDLKHFPDIFNALPITRTGIKEGVSSPPSQSVLTDHEVTKILNVDEGYPLEPRDGGDWQWVGEWQVETSSNTDEEGWSYSYAYEIAPDSVFHNKPQQPKEFIKNNTLKRRRKWVRGRALVDYPLASTMTKEYLKLAAEKAVLLYCQQVMAKDLEKAAVKLKMLVDDCELLEQGMGEKSTRIQLEMTDTGENNKVLLSPLEEISNESNRTKRVLKTEDCTVSPKVVKTATQGPPAKNDLAEKNTSLLTSKQQHIRTPKRDQPMHELQSTVRQLMSAFSSPESRRA